MADETEVETVVRLHATDVRDLYPSISPEDAGSRVCFLCSMRLKDKTHNLTRHLERHHPAALLQLLEQRSQASPSSAARRSTPTRKHKPVAASPRTEEDAGWEARLASANHALAKWLAHEELPLDLVENAEFRVFVETLNNQFRPSRRDELPGLLDSRTASQDALEDQPADAPMVQDTSSLPMLSRVLRATSRSSDEVPHVQYQTVACRVLQEGEARVRVLCAAGSLTDAQTCRGRLLGRNGVLGRSFVGVVAHMQPDAAADAPEGDVALHINDKVVVSPYLPCPACRQRDQDASSWCPHEAQCVGVNATTGALAEYVTLPASNLHVVPPSLSNELLLLADDVSVAVAIGNEISSRHVKTVAVLTDARSGCLASVIAFYLHHTLGLPLTSVQLITDSSAQPRRLGESSATVVHVDFSQPHGDLWRHSAFDAAVDLCGTENSIDWAIRATRPLGCMLLVDRSRFAPDRPATVAMDVNTVVVNELDVVGIEDCCAEMPQAIAYIERQARDPLASAQLRALVSAAAVAFPDALKTLARAPEVTFESQYVLVDMTTTSRTVTGYT